MKKFASELFSPLKKGMNVLGTTGDVISSAGENVKTFIEEGANIAKTKLSSSVEEEKLEQATNRVLMKAACIKKIMNALDCTWQEACDILEEELHN